MVIISSLCKILTDTVWTIKTFWESWFMTPILFQYTNKMIYGPGMRKRGCQSLTGQTLLTCCIVANPNCFDQISFSLLRRRKNASGMCSDRLCPQGDNLLSTLCTSYWLIFKRPLSGGHLNHLWRRQRKFFSTKRARWFYGPVMRISDEKVRIWHLESCVFRIPWIRCE